MELIAVKRAVQALVELHAARPGPGALRVLSRNGAARAAPRGRWADRSLRDASGVARTPRRAVGPAGGLTAQADARTLRREAAQRLARAPGETGREAPLSLARSFHGPLR